MSRAIDRVVNIIKSIAQETNEGDTIVREIRAQELRGVWTNTNTKKEYSIGANVVRRLFDNERNDPRVVPVLQFIANQITAVEAKRDIEKLENLKAFW